ncbi:hypothetical protein GCM10023324_06960 [Streptomyces youssoufiensis]
MWRLGGVSTLSGARGRAPVGAVLARPGGPALGSGAGRGRCAVPYVAGGVGGVREGRKEVRKWMANA